MILHSCKSTICSNAFWVFAAMFFVLFGVRNSNAQSDKEFVDSILAQITPTTSDTTKVRLYHDIALNCNSADTVKKYALLSLHYCKDTDTFNIASNYTCLLWACNTDSELAEGINYGKKALAICGDNQDSNVLRAKTSILLTMANMYNDLNMIDSSFMFNNMAKEVSFKIQNYFYVCYIYSRLLTMFSDRKFYETAWEYLDSLMFVSTSHNLSFQLSASYLYQSYLEMATSGDTLENVLKAARSVKTADYINDTMTVKYETHSVLLQAQNVYMKLAHITDIQEYADTCYYYTQKIGSFYKENGFSDFIIQQYNYADYLLFKKRPKEALKAIQECVPFIKEDMHPLYMHMYYYMLSSIYYDLGHYPTALKYLETAHLYRQKNNSETVSNDMADFKVLLFTNQQKRLNEIERQNLELQIQAENRHSKVVLYVTLAVLFLILVSAFFLMRTFVLKRRANEELSVKNSLLQQQREEIEVQRDVLSVQKLTLEKINRKIMASVVYAQRIQHAAMPSEQSLKTYFPDSFLYFEPKEVVSGDYYYSTSIGGYKVIVTADCSGHGIPGGFLSMLGIFGLKEFLHTVYDAQNPDVILGKMNIFVQNSLSSQSLQHSIDDGMDMSVCSISPDGKKLRFAAANQTAILVCNGKPLTLTGNAVSIGRLNSDSYIFETSEIDIHSGDMVYMFTDGIEPFKSGFTDLLVSISSRPIQEQYDALFQFINNWHSTHQQDGDITIIGARL